MLHIATGVSLAAALGVATVIVVASVAFRLHRADAEERAYLRFTIGRGATGGVLATVGYDASRALLSRLDPSPFNPFEAIRVFGELLAGPGAPPWLQHTAGGWFHLLNGMAFGIAFALFFRRPSLAMGVAWGLALELAQLAIFPGWLDIKFVSEFAQFSAAGHLVYGAILGAWCGRPSAIPTPEA